MDALQGLIEALAPDHAHHVGREHSTAGQDVHVKCSCGVRLTFLAAQIATIASSESTTPKTRAVR